MNYKYLLVSFFMVSFMVSCSSDDEDFGPAIPESTAINYLPLTQENQWIYHNRVNIPNQQYTNESEETITAADTSTVSETASYKFTSNATSKNQGVMTLMLTNGYVNKVEGKIIFNGHLDLSIPVLEQRISIPVTNLVLLNQNANAGTPLSTVHDAYTQDFTFSGKTVPVTINYILETSEGSVYEAYDNGLQNYQNVIASKLKLTLSASASIMNFDLDLLLNQPVLETTNYFAKDIGLILSQSDIHMEFEDLSEFNVPQLPAVIGTSSQVLNDYRLQ